MAKTNIVFIAQSLDGYIADKKGGLEWLQMVPNPNNESTGFNELLEKIDALLMGRNTYETVLGFGKDWLYSKPVFVLSNSLKEISDSLIDKVHLVKGKLQEILDHIHHLGYYKLYIGGGNVVQQFLENELIDEMGITSMPVLLGGGTPLFGALANPQEWKHIKTEVLLEEMVQSWYRKK